jgi:hypothetical protein
MAIIKLSATERRRVSAFLTCLALAVVAWIFTVLSSPNKYTVRAVLSFKNAPQKRAFHLLQSDTVNITVAGNGWDMLFSKMNPGNKLITADLRTLENRNYVVLSSQLDQINIKKEGNQQITNFNPDTLYFDFSNRRVREVPIILRTAIGYRRQFTQSGDITIQPAYVTISGPENVIDKIKEWQTDTLKLDSVSQTVSARVSIRPVREGNMTIYPQNVQVTIPVDEFTEKTLLIPVKLVNNHNNDDVKVFPQKVKITFTIPLSRYAETDEDFFEATADLDLWRLHSYKVLPVSVNKIPPYCKIVKTEPQNVDFIIKK